MAAADDCNIPAWARNPPIPITNVRAIAQTAIDVYLCSQQEDGEIGGIGWWQTANGYIAMALHDIWSGTKSNHDRLARAVRSCESRKPGLVNEFNDDTLWWALCCLHVYTLGEDIWYLDQARNIWRHVRDSNSVCRRGQARFRGMDMEGACYWTTNLDEEQINSITTGLYAELSVRLAFVDQVITVARHSSNPIAHRPIVSRDEYVETARCCLGWILRCRYRAEDAVVLDNIMLQRQEARDWTFTYTTGVAIGTCALLFQSTGESEYLSLACTMANGAMRRRSWVEENGVLTEHDAYGKGHHEPGQNNDAVGFKAVLMRHLATLYRIVLQSGTTNTQAVRTAHLIKIFVNVNVQSQQASNTSGHGQYGPWWNGPFEMPTSHSQMAVLDVMAAAVLVD